MTVTLDQDSTATPDPDGGFPVFIWFGKPNDVDREHLLMAITLGPDDEVPSYRPLIALSVEQAAGQQTIAQAAADDLGVTAVLREFEYVAMVDRLEPNR